MALNVLLIPVAAAIVRVKEPLDGLAPYFRGHRDAELLESLPTERVKLVGRRAGKNCGRRQGSHRKLDGGFKKVAATDTRSYIRAVIDLVTVLLGLSAGDGLRGKQGSGDRRWEEQPRQ